MKIGDKVAVISENLQGMIVNKNAEIYTILTDLGLEIPFKKDELVKFSDEISLNNQTKNQFIQEKEAYKKKKSVAVKRKGICWEIDLHLEKLVSKSTQMGEMEALDFQLDIARNQLELAIQKGVQKVIFIHGVGQGILRTELEYLLGRYKNVSFCEADYTKYGQGATEVYIYKK